MRVPSATDALASGFAEPPRSFSPAPLWWWSGEALDRGRLRWQMERFVDGGVYNLVVINLAATGPYGASDADQPAFLSDAWWEIFTAVCEDAQVLGVRLWFYDQIGFASSNIKERLVHREPRFGGWRLQCAVREGEGPLTVECPPEGRPLAAMAIEIDDRGEAIGEPMPLPLAERRAGTEKGGRQRLRLVYAVPHGFDYLQPEACRRLLDAVHGAFERRAGRFFGTVIAGSFQDELAAMPTWSERFAAEFRQRKGYDLLPHLHALWEGRAPSAEGVRADYQKLRAELAEESFFRPLGEWHARHGLICGFDQMGGSRTGLPIDTVALYGDYLRTQRWYGAPGSDHRGEGKIHSSLAHLHGHPRAWLEGFHSTGWGATLEEIFDWLLPWLRAGATLFNPHAAYYSTRGGWWEWAPPSTCWRQPYWRHHSLFAQTVSRLCFLLSQGVHVCDIGVLHPTTTAQADLTLAGALPPAAAAHAVYRALVGSMVWERMEPGVLDRDRRDFDILDDASVQSAQIEDGHLCVGGERYRAIVLPACEVLESDTAEALCRFVAGGGRLVGVAGLPRLAVDGDPRPAEALRQLFETGKATFVRTAEEVPDALADLPRRVEAPMPVLHRRVDGRDVLFIPAAFPRATRCDAWGGLRSRAYTFDPGAYQRTMRVHVRGVKGAPELWDPLTGERRTLPATAVADGIEVIVPFDGGPAAVLVWPGERERAENPPSALEPVARRPWLRLDGPWESRLEPTLENRYGDLARPAYPGAPPVQTWRFEHRRERPAEDGLRAGWHLPPPVLEPRQGGEPWEEVESTYGTYGWSFGPCPEAALPAPLTAPAAGDDPLATAGWKPAIYSLSRGIRRDPLHDYFGPRGHVPEEFLDFGAVKAGEGVQYRTAVWVPEAQRVHLALGAPALKRAWVNGEPVGEGTAGYLWLPPVRLAPGMNSIEWRLVAAEEVNLRAFWALVRRPERFARPEAIMAAGEPRRGRRLLFSRSVRLPFAPAAATVQVVADVSCRLLVNGEEVGYQHNFTPWDNLTRVQPHTVRAFRQGENRIAVELEDPGRPVAVQLDGVVNGADGSTLSFTSGSDWQVECDGEAPAPVCLRRRQWEIRLGSGVGVDPAWLHLWRRPHPLPWAMWLEDRSPDDTVLPVVPDAMGGAPRVEWFRWILPPGAAEMHLPVVGEARVWVDGREVRASGGRVPLPRPEAMRRLAVLRVVPDRGRTGGGVFEGPVTYSMGPGRIALEPWADQGLEAYSGGIRYRTSFAAGELPDGRIELDLGRVRGTAEVCVNGRPAGVRIWSPYYFDITDLVRPGTNTVEILVCNTLAPYLRAVGPTPYVLPGQECSGILGPVQIVTTGAVESRL